MNDLALARLVAAILTRAKRDAESKRLRGDEFNAGEAYLWLCFEGREMLAAFGVTTDDLDSFLLEREQPTLFVGR